MSFLSRLSSKNVDEFARLLAIELSKKYPPEIQNPKDEKSKSSARVSEKRLTRILEDLYAKARQFHTENKLGIYKKARLSNTFRWELDSLGYSKDFVELAVEGMVVYLTRKTDDTTPKENKSA